MKKYIYKIVCGLMMLGPTSCLDLDLAPTTDLTSDLFWQSVDDATAAMYGVYNVTRTFFFREHGWDGASDMVWADNIPDYKLKPSSGIGASMNNKWNQGYQVVNAANSTLEHIEVMLSNMPEAADELNRIKGEVYFLRAITYFRLMDLWGDIPFYTHVLNGNSEAYSLSRTPREKIKDCILDDLLFASKNVPDVIPSAERGRVSKAAVYAFSGKIKLYWACWMKNEGNIEEAKQYYKYAADDFKEAMDPKYGLSLFENGNPGTEDEPNYLKLFDGLHEDNPEVVFAIGNAGPNKNGLGDYYVYDFASRSCGNGGCNEVPTIRLMNRYQLVSTGDFADPLVIDNTITDPDEREKVVNGACNPDSYKGRDWRMYACMWDGQRMVSVSTDGQIVGPDTLTFKYGFKGVSDGVSYIDATGPNTGYIFRKYVRTYAYAKREEGGQDIYLMRLPDLWLMYCEAVNEINDGPTSELFDLIDKIRHRGNLPGLDRNKYNAKDSFFKAIEQERIVELVAEGHRFFDIRRWHMIEELWPAPNGYKLTCTWGESKWYREEFKNAQDIDYQRVYLFKIPDGEIKQNPNLTQNDCWL